MNDNYHFDIAISLYASILPLIENFITEQIETNQIVRRRRIIEFYENL